MLRDLLQPLLPKATTAVNRWHISHHPLYQTRPLLHQPPLQQQAVQPPVQLSRALQQLRGRQVAVVAAAA
jgi:hypothetical protein